MAQTKRSKSHSNASAFTLVELLVALMVSSIVLTAVTTLAFAMASANDTTDDTSRKQAQVRYTTLKISDLIRHCKLVCFAGPDDFALWRADDNDDGQINISELIYIEKGAASDRLRLCEFSNADSVVNLSDILALSTGWYTAYAANADYTAIIPQCSNVQFSFDVLPPNTRFVSISVDLAENNISRQYQVNAFVRGWAGNLLNDDADAIITDDD